MSGSLTGLARLFAMQQQPAGDENPWLAAIMGKQPMLPPAEFYTPLGVPLMGAGPRGMPDIAMRRRTAPTTDLGDVAGRQNTYPDKY